MDFWKLYYHLTAYMPRRLPTTEADFLKFKDVLLKYYGLKDEPQTYVVISGQIQSTPGHKIRKCYGHIANHVKRVKINALAQCYKIAATQQLQSKMEALVKQQAEEESKTSIQGRIDGEPVSDAGVPATPGRTVLEAT